jgi:spore germination cell wall hydrolase CwlJ-like protein
MDEKTKIVSLVIAGEAGGEGVEGMKAVACVIANRMDKRNKSAYDIVTQRFQFSAYEDMPMCERNYKDVNDVTDALAMCLYSGVFFKLIKDSTRGADHYLTRKLYYSDKRPSWADDMVIMAEIGNHVFLT